MMISDLKIAGDRTTQQGLSDWHNKNSEDTRMTAINYSETMRKLEESAGTDDKYVKFGPGKHTIEFMEEIPQFQEKFFAPENRNILQTDVKVKHEGKEKTLTLHYSKTGFAGQLIKLGAARNNALKGSTATILVQKETIDGKARNKYTVVEAV